MRVNATTVCCDSADKVPDSGLSGEGVVNCTCVDKAPGRSLDDIMREWAEGSERQGDAVLPVSEVFSDA